MRFRLPLFITIMAHFSIPNSILMSWLYILTACIRVSNSFSFSPTVWCRPCTLGNWFFPTIYCLCPAVHFLSMWFSGIITIINSHGDSASPWSIPLRIFASALLFPSAVNSTFQVFIDFSIKFTTSSDILYILRQLIIQLCGTISYAFFCSQSRL